MLGSEDNSEIALLQEAFQLEEHEGETQYVYHNDERYYIIISTCESLKVPFTTKASCIVIKQQDLEAIVAGEPVAETPEQDHGADPAPGMEELPPVESNEAPEAAPEEIPEEIPEETPEPVAEPTPEQAPEQLDDSFFDSLDAPETAEPVGGPNIDATPEPEVSLDAPQEPEPVSAAPEEVQPVEDMFAMSFSDEPTPLPDPKETLPDPDAPASDATEAETDDLGDFLGDLPVEDQPIEESLAAVAAAMGEEGEGDDHDDTLEHDFAFNPDDLLPDGPEDPNETTPDAVSDAELAALEQSLDAFDLGPDADEIEAETAADLPESPLDAAEALAEDLAADLAPVEEAEPELEAQSEPEPESAEEPALEEPTPQDLTPEQLAEKKQQARQARASSSQSREESLDLREQALLAREEAVSQREHALYVKEDEMDARILDVEERTKQISLRREELDNWETKLKTRRGYLEQQEQSVAETRRHIRSQLASEFNGADDA